LASHLETPASRDANLWLAHVLSVMAGLEAIPSKRARVPAWPLDDLEHRWPEGSGGGLLLRAREVLAEVIALGESHLLFFRRNPWLLGWRRGIPGMNVNSLYALACRASNIEPTEAAGDHLASMAKEFSEILEDFRHGLTGYLLAERLAMTMSESANPIPGRELQEERAALFGPPMQAGGLCGELQSRLEELVRLGLNTRH
jgi:hypothetical protein